MASYTNAFLQIPYIRNLYFRGVLLRIWSTLFFAPEPWTQLLTHKIVQMQIPYQN
jgi:hypothetical protein